MAQVVDDDTEPVRPVAVLVADREIAGWGHLRNAFAGQLVRPSLDPVAERDAPNRADNVPVAE